MGTWKRIQEEQQANEPHYAADGDAWYPREARGGLTCPECEVAIEPGERVLVHEDGSMAMHHDCFQMAQDYERAVSKEP